MTKPTFLLALLLVLPGFTGCSSTPSDAEMKDMMEDGDDDFFDDSSPKKQQAEKQKDDGTKWAGYSCRVPGSMVFRAGVSDKNKLSNAVIKQKDAPDYVSVTLLPSKGRNNAKDDRLAAMFSSAARKEHKGRGIVWRKKARQSEMKIGGVSMKSDIWLADIDGKPGVVEVLSGTREDTGDFVATTIVADKKRFKTWHKNASLFLSSCTR